jgi:hypothetical protein
MNLPSAVRKAIVFMVVVPDVSGSDEHLAPTRASVTAIFLANAAVQYEP